MQLACPFCSCSVSVVEDFRPGAYVCCRRCGEMSEYDGSRLSKAEPAGSSGYWRTEADLADVSSPKRGTRTG
jgi:hypothetical protein